MYTFSESIVMKKIILTLCLFSLFGVISLSAQAQQVETRSLGSFNRIKASSSFEVILKKGNDESVRIEARNVDPSKVVTEIDGDRLKLYMKRGNYRKMRVKVTVTYRELEEIVSSGSGNLEAHDLIQADELTLINSGSGNLTLSKVSAGNMMVKLSGSANLKLAGQSADLIVHVSGSGNVDAFLLKAEAGEVRVSGSGNVKMYVSQLIDASVSGSGNVHYKGNPERTYVKTSGSGMIQGVN